MWVSSPPPKTIRHYTQLHQGDLGPGRYIPFFVTPSEPLTFWKGLEQKTKIFIVQRNREPLFATSLEWEQEPSEHLISYLGVGYFLTSKKKFNEFNSSGMMSKGKFFVAH